MFKQGIRVVVQRSSLVFAECFLVVTIAVLLTMAGPAQAGVFTLEIADNANTTEKVVHPHGYDGSGGDVEVSVCISPDSPSIQDMEPGVKNAIATWNGMSPVIGNLRQGSDSGMAPGQMDFESVMLHEIGHCIGLGHPNMTGSSSTSEATVTGSGGNGVFDLVAGADGIHGSHDDLRGDDVNYHRFAPGVNDPFRSVGTVVDRSTYTRDLSQLPNGHEFARNAGRAVASYLGLVPTEAVMQQGARDQEAQRSLVADDVDTLRYARSGVDGIQGTSDDYDLRLVYGGVRSDCDIQVRQQSLSPGALGFCVKAAMNTLSSGNFAMAGQAQVRVNANVNWHYGDNVQAASYPFWPAQCPSEPATDCHQFQSAKLKIKPGMLKLGASLGNISRFQIPRDGASFAACLYADDGLAGQWAMPGPEGWKFKSTKMVYKSATARFKGGVGKMKFKAKTGGLPLQAPQDMQLQVISGLGNCWAASFDEVDAHPEKLGMLRAQR